MNRFKDKVVVVTGGSEGIGFATAKLFAAEGARVYITGRRQDRLDAAVAELGSGVIGVQGDSANLADLDRLYERVRRDDRKIDSLFANAGVAGVTALADITEQEFDRIFDINVRGVLFTVQKALPLLKDGGSVVLNGSVTGSKGLPNQSIYNATKAAIRSFARSWTTDLKTRGIRVNVVSPGPIETPAMKGFIQAQPGAREMITQLVPLGRIGQADEVAKAVLFLASDDASYIAGTELFVDGGAVAV